jgi:signal transduction histidine kinase
MMQGNPRAQADPHLRQLVAGVVKGTARLQRVFNSILDVSRVMTGGLQIHRSPVSIAATLEAIALEFRPAKTVSNRFFPPV